MTLYIGIRRQRSTSAAAPASRYRLFHLKAVLLETPARLGGAGHRHPSQDSVDQQGSTGWATSGTLVKLHLGSFGQLLALDTSSLTDLGPDGQQTLPVSNVLRNEI
jgi:hypothetical protein